MCFIVSFSIHSLLLMVQREPTTAGRVLSPRSIMVRQGFRRREAGKKAKYRLPQATSHSSLLDARQADISRKLNQAFLQFFYRQRTFKYIYDGRLSRSLVSKRVVGGKRRCGSPWKPVSSRSPPTATVDC